MSYDNVEMMLYPKERVPALARLPDLGHGRNCFELSNLRK
jgi:hypothetical protein